MTKVPEHLPDGSRRSAALQRLLQDFVDAHDIDQDIVDGSDHPGSCRCDKCLKWWSELGPDEDGKYGPFSVEEVDNFREQNA